MFRRKDQIPDERTRLVGLTASGDSTFSLNWDPDYADPLEGFIHRISFFVEIKEPNENGFHHGPEGNYLHDLGDAFELASQGHARLMGSVTGGGMKIFHYYANNIEWIPAHESALRESEDHRFVIKVEEDPHWEFYKKVLMDAVQADNDRQVWAVLEESDADLDQPHRIDWFLFFPTQEQAREAERILVEHEYEVDVGPPQESKAEDWCVQATLNVKLSLGYIAHMTAMFLQFAEDHAGVYDGWGAAVDPKVGTNTA